MKSCKSNLDIRKRAIVARAKSTLELETLQKEPRENGHVTVGEDLDPILSANDVITRS